LSYRGWNRKEVLEPSGAWSASALIRKGNPSRASIAQNMRFAPGRAFTREGTSNILASAGAVAGMFDWISPTDHLLAYMDGSAIKRFRFSDSNILQLLGSLPGNAYAPSIADLGPRLYFSAYDTSNTGVIQAHVYDGTTGVDTCFRPPLQFLTSFPLDVGSGNCTQGLHYAGCIFQSRSGFAGKPSPVDGSMVFQPIQISVNAPLRKITLNVQFDTGADAGPGSALYPIVTRADNPNLYYFVPDTFVVPPASTPGWGTAFTINISDEDLAAFAEPATDQFNVLSQVLAGTGPFNVNFVAPYGLRMCYGVKNQLYVSDINDPQVIAADRNLVQTSGQRNIAIAAQLGQMLYLHGDKWTGGVQDNGDFPSTWPQPSTVSDAIGAAYPNCIETKTGGTYHWVVAESGVYLFDGQYSERPVTYLVSDLWKRVNWAAAYAIQTADDVVGLRLFVAVPLDGATSPTHQFTIDYTNGKAFNTCQISLDNYGFGNFRSLAMVKETTNRTALWIGPAAAGQVTHLDPATHNDVGSAIHPVWESGLVRDGADAAQSLVVRVGGAHVWARGSGSLLVTAYGLDRTIDGGTDTLALIAAPGAELLSKFDLKSENYTVRFETNAIGDWFELSGFRSYTKPDVYNR
jgi:hypothetical protein